MQDYSAARHLFSNLNLKLPDFAHLRHTFKQIIYAFFFPGIDWVFFGGDTFDEIDRVGLGSNISILRKGVVSNKRFSVTQKEYLVTSFDACLLCELLKEITIVQN